MPKPKWLITKPALKTSERKSFWEQHHAEGYQKIYSMTDDPALRARIVSELASLRTRRKILIPGCGSKYLLERDIAEKVPGCKYVLCTDFAKVAAIAARQNRNRAIEYKGLDSAKLGITKQFDAVVIVNSVLSDRDAENRKIIASCFRALKPGGYLIGFFPTIFWALDIALTTKSPYWRAYLRRHVELETFSEGAYLKGQKKSGPNTQIYYGPLLLNQILKEAGFVKRKLENYFLDSGFFVEQGKNMYGITDPDVSAYEMFVTAQRPAGRLRT
jgi:SAM-dependent methyltransferase